MKTGLIKDVISPDEAMKEFEERLEDYAYTKIMKYKYDDRMF